MRRELIQRASACVCATTVAALLPAFGASAAHAAVSGTNGEFVYSFQYGLIIGTGGGLNSGHMLVTGTGSGVTSQTGWTPDGSRLFYSENGDLHSVAADGGDTVELTSATTGFSGGYDPAVDSTGSYVAFDDNGTLYRGGTDGSWSQSLIPGTQPTWDAATGSLVFVDGDGRLAYLRTAETGFSAVDLGVTATEPDISPDGTLITYVDASGKVAVAPLTYDSSTGQISSIGTAVDYANGVGTAQYAPRFSADGTQLAWGTTSVSGMAHYYNIYVSTVGIPASAELSDTTVGPGLGTDPTSFSWQP